MVPELAGAAAAELANLREAVFAAAAALPIRWVAVGVGPSDAVIGPRHDGTFAGYGVDVHVALSPDGRRVPGEMPLAALITGWVRGRARPDASAEVRLYADTHHAQAAVALGRRLRAAIDQAAEPVGVLVVADGAHTLTAPAPGGYRPESLNAQAALDDALSRGDVDALTRLPGAIVGRVAYQVLAGLAESGSSAVTELYRGAPYGVGYFAGVWRPAGARAGSTPTRPKGRGTTGGSTA